MLNALFEDPYWLLCWGILPVSLLVLFSYIRWRNRQLALLGPAANRLVRGFSKQVYFRNGVLWMASFFLLVVVMANPHWGTRRVFQTHKAADVIIAFDISRSMLATDLRPNRLVRARLFAQDLLSQLSGNSVGLLFFAGDAFLSMPPSTDYGTLNTLISEADPDNYSAQGTAIESVVELASKTFDPGASASRALIIITDGEEHEGDPVSAISTALDGQGIQTYIVGAGTTEGGFVFTAGGSTLVDANGEAVRSKMNVALLAEMAEAGGSNLVHFVADQEEALAFLVKEISELPKRDIAVRQYDSQNSIYQWFLLPAILILLFEFLGVVRVYE